MARGGGSALYQLARGCTYPGAGTQSSAAGALPNRGLLFAVTVPSLHMFLDP